MHTRLQLDAYLRTILGSNNTYFQPPSSIQMQFPAIVYRLDSIEILPADNLPYLKAKRYQVIYISKNPDDPMVDTLLDVPYCRFVRHYSADNLNHWVFNLYY